MCLQLLKWYFIKMKNLICILVKMFKIFMIFYLKQLDLFVSQRENGKSSISAVAINCNLSQIINFA